MRNKDEYKDDLRPVRLVSMRIGWRKVHAVYDRMTIASSASGMHWSSACEQFLYAAGQVESGTIEAVTCKPCRAAAAAL